MKLSILTGVASLVAIAVALLASLAPLSATAGAATSTDGAWTFPSNTTLNPPSIALIDDPSGQVSSEAGSPAYLFLAPIQNFAVHAAFAGKQGPEILEADGNPVWEDPLGQLIKVGTVTRKVVAMDFHVATLYGQPVLVWWQGYITPNGFGTGAWEIANDHYKTIASLQAPPGYETDFHAFEITPNGMAYFLASKTVHISLHCCGGPTNGALYDQVIFEVDIKTTHVVWSWDPLQHIPLRESYANVPAKEPWDPYHLNSIALGPTGNLILSARDTWAAYWIYRTGHDIGDVFATLGGKHSTFAMGTDVHFAWQHDVSYLPGQKLSVFADEATPPEAAQSRGLVVALDWANHTTTAVHQYFLPHPALTGSQGSVQKLPDGNVFVGWGQLPYFSEYTTAGKLLYLGTLSGPDESYRIYRQPWVGMPESKPTITVTSGHDGDVAEIGASWNGATGVTSWQLLAGASATTLAAYATPVLSHTFETTIPTTSAGPYYAVEAIDKAGGVLGTSPAMTVPATAPVTK